MPFDDSIEAIRLTKDVHRLPIMTVCLHAAVHTTVGFCCVQQSACAVSNSLLTLCTKNQIMLACTTNDIEKTNLWTKKKTGTELLRHPPSALKTGNEGRVHFQRLTAAVEGMGHRMVTSYIWQSYHSIRQTRTTKCHQR